MPISWGGPCGCRREMVDVGAPPAVRARDTVHQALTQHVEDARAMMEFLRRLWRGSLSDFEYEISPPRDDLPPEVSNPRDCSMKLLHIPAGGFWAGGVHADRVNNPGPNATFAIDYLPDCYIGETEVTNTQYARFLTDAQPSKSDLHLYIFLSRDHHRHAIVAEGESYSVTGGVGDHPVTCVSWYGANAYCEWAGLRLPTELEWEKSARGTDGYLFPWGNEWDASRCHNPDNRHGGNTTPVYAFEQGKSPFGVWDMAGNVSEWCWDFYSFGVYRRYRKGDIRPQRSGAERVARGCSYTESTMQDALSYRCSRRGGIRPGAHAPLTGFRCAMTPPA